MFERRHISITISFGIYIKFRECKSNVYSILLEPLLFFLGKPQKLYAFTGDFFKSENNVQSQD